MIQLNVNHAYYKLNCYYILIIILGIIYCLRSNNGTPKQEFQLSNNKEFQLFGSAESEHNINLINKLKNDLAIANEKIEQLENKMQGFDERIRKPYPNVKYLNYRSKKRILVR